MLSIWHCIWRWQLPHVDGLKNLAVFFNIFQVWSCVEDHQMHGKLKCYLFGSTLEVAIMCKRWGSRTWPIFKLFIYLYFQFNLRWAITKCKLRIILFKCYLFEGAFVGDCLHPDGLKKLVAFKNVFLGFVFCKESSRANTTLMFVSFQLVFSWMFQVHSPFIYFGKLEQPIKIKN